MPDCYQRDEFHLSESQKEQFDRDGYLVLRAFFTKQKASALHNRAKQLLQDFSLEGHPMTRFTTEEDEEHVGDDYFLTSGDKIRFFFEDAAFSNGQLNRPKELAVNKIGHALHDLDPPYREFTLENKDLQNLVRELSFHRDPRVIQSMIICKQKEVGGAVPSHDDSTFLYTDPVSALGFWFALEDCTVSNGCLSFIPGSHKVNKITKRLERLQDGGGTTIKQIHGMETEHEAMKAYRWDENETWKIEECQAGDLVLIHGSVIHRSERNLSSKSRFIYTFHMIEGEAKWPASNWLQQDRPFTKFA